MKLFEQKNSSWFWARKHQAQIQVLDHDGWEHKNEKQFNASMAEPISEKEWWYRVSESTCRLHKPPKPYHRFAPVRAFSSMLKALEGKLLCK